MLWKVPGVARWCGRQDGSNVDPNADDDAWKKKFRVDCSLWPMTATGLLPPSSRLAFEEGGSSPEVDHPNKPVFAQSVEGSMHTAAYRIYMFFPTEVGLKLYSKVSYLIRRSNVDSVDDQRWEIW
ncbi:hypothetical protein QAD02_007558 [Eretmocerus hayati]|uniref:Uncharacterized protein n=1 Tax=Eretmocerus hayati TaxID=131215 RepID=A0ACC2N4S3_9HYME|nr:hypothetical protein QAD02_007558 [Eretmocerus hayati]